MLLRAIVLIVTADEDSDEHIDAVSRQTAHVAAPVGVVV